MARGKKSKARKLILDLGSSAIRLCELTQTKAGYQLTKYYQRDVPFNTELDDDARKQFRTDLLKGLLKEAKVGYRKSVLAVTGQSVFSRTRALPPVPDYKLTQIVRYEIQQQIPFALDQIALDFQVLNRTEAGGYDVLMAAIKVDVVEKQLDVLKDIKRQIDTVDVSPLAAYNWLKHSGEFGEEEECVALLDMGAATTDIVVESGGQFRFTRSLNLGGNDITRAISNAFGMDMDQAEKVKREKGFAPTGDTQRDGKAGEVIGGVLNRLVTEITRSFAYFRSQPGGATISRVIITGGGACLRNIVPYLQRQLAIEVRIAQPLAGLAVAPTAQEVNEHPEQACVVLGLALRCCETVPVEINLIPPRVRDAARRKEQAFYWALSLATLAVIFASIIPDMANDNKHVKQEIEKLRGLVRMYDPELGRDPIQRSKLEDELDKVTTRVNKYSGQMQQLDGVLAMRLDWLRCLKEVNDARPVGKAVWISSVQSTNIAGAPEVVAQTYSYDEDDEDYYDEDYEDYGAYTPAYTPPGQEGGLLSRLNSFGFTGLFPMGSSAPAYGAVEPAVLPPMGTNGLMILGYAQDPEALQNFINRLKEVKIFQVGVYADDATFLRVPWESLDNAKVGASSASSYGSMGGGGFDYDEDEEDEDYGGFGGGYRGGSGMPADYVPGTSKYLPTEFRIDVQFMGKPVSLEG